MKKSTIAKTNDSLNNINIGDLWQLMRSCSILEYEFLSSEANCVVSTCHVSC